MSRLHKPRSPCGSRGLALRLGAAFAAAYAPAATAFQPLVTDDTGTQGAGGNQVELALNRQEFRSEGIKSTTKTIPVVYTRGVTETLDLYAGVSHGRIDSDDPGVEARGHGNPLLGAKWRIYEHEAQKFSIGFKPEVQFGSSADDERRGISIGRNGFSGSMIVTQETSFGAVHANYAYARINYALEANRSAQRSNLHRLSVAPVFELGSVWRLAIDAGITTNPRRRERARMGFIETGGIWSPVKDLDLALGWIQFLGDGEPRASTLTAGLTWRFR